MRWGRAKHWIGSGLGILLVTYLLWRMPWANTLNALAQVRLQWWLPALALGAFGVWFRALRLQWVLGSSEPLLGVWRAVAFGYLSGLFLPAGGGELVKVRTLMKARGLDAIHALSGVALDRLLDLVGLALGLALLGSLQTLPGKMGTLLRVMSLVLLFTGLFLALFLSQGRALIARLSGSLSNRPWLAGRLKRMGEVLKEADHLRASRTWIRLLLFQVFITSFEFLTITIALKALPVTVPLPFWAGLQVQMFSAIGFALPLLPGAAGSLQVAYLLALRPWGVPIAQALAFSILAHLGHLLVVIGHGGLAFLLRPETLSPVEG